MSGIQWLRALGLVAPLALGLTACSLEIPEQPGEAAGVAQQDLSGAGRAPFRVDVLLMREVRTCFIGDPCTFGPCVGLRDDTGALRVAFADNAWFHVVREDDPAIGRAGLGQCVKLGLSDLEVENIRRELELTADNVRAWSGRDLHLRLVIHEVPSVSLALSRWGPGPWLAPWDLRATVERYLSPQTDFVIVTSGVRDSVTGYHHDVAGCGGTFGSDYGLAGAGWSWVPSTGASFWFECAEQSVYTHEWLHQLHFAVQNLSCFDDLYHGVYPACGAGDPDPTLWFPDSHACLVDPDYVGCSTGSCGTADQLVQHILGAHYSRALRVVANSCRDGIRNYGETAIDEGGPCLGRKAGPGSHRACGG